MGTGRTLAVRREPSGMHGHESGLEWQVYFVIATD